MACKFIDLGNGASAFVCGRKVHECDDKGPIIYGLSDGFEGSLNAICHKYKINPDYCSKDIVEILHEKDIIVMSSSVSCSKCGRSAINRAMYHGL